MIKETRNLLGFIRSRLPLNDYHPVFTEAAHDRSVQVEIQAYDGNGMLFSLHVDAGRAEVEHAVFGSPGRPDWVDYFEVIEVGTDYETAPRWRSGSFEDRDGPLVRSLFRREIESPYQSDEYDVEIDGDDGEDLPSAEIVGQWSPLAQLSRPSFGRKIMYVAFNPALDEPSASDLASETLNERLYRLARSQKYVDRVRTDIRRSIGGLSAQVWQADDQIIIAFVDRRPSQAIVEASRALLERSCVFDYMVAETSSLVISDASGLSPLRDWITSAGKYSR